MKIHGSKGIIDLDDIEPVDIELQDIAGSLSRQARFNGNGDIKISVAQHCIVGATALAGGTGNYMAALWFLLHDAHETYTGDIITPMKNKVVDLGGGDPIRDMQDHLDDVISRKLFFGFDFNKIKEAAWYQSVIDLDKFLARHEASRLFDYVEKPAYSGPVGKIAAYVYNGEQISRALMGSWEAVPQCVKALVYRRKADLVLKHQSLNKSHILQLKDYEVSTLYTDLYRALYASAAIQRCEEA